MKKYIFTLILVFGGALSYAQEVKNDTIQVATEQWEYMSLYVSNTHMYAKQGEVNFKNHDKLFNEYGLQGWELVSVVPLIGSNMGNGHVYTSNLCYTFKRRVINTANQ